MPSIGNQEIFIGFKTPLTSLKFSQQMSGISSVGLCVVPDIIMHTTENSGVYEYINSFTIDTTIHNWSILVRSKALLANPDFIENEDVTPFLPAPADNAIPVDFKVTFTEPVNLVCLPTTVAVGFRFSYLLSRGWVGDFDILNSN